MYHDRNRRREPRRTEWTPNVVLSFRGQTEEVFFHPADEAAQAAFFQNLRKLDEGGLKEVAGQAQARSFNGGSPVAILGVEDLRRALKVGEELFTGLPEDGPARNCGLCSEQFQPHKRNSFERDNGAATFVGGDIGIVKKDVLVQFVALLRKEYAEKLKQFEDAMTKWQASQPTGDTPPAGGRFLDLTASTKPTPPVDPAEVINRIASSVETTMAEVIGDAKPPELAVALPLGFRCGCQGRMRDACAVTLVAQESVLAALAYADQRIGTAMDRGKTASMLEVLGARPQRYSAGPSDGRRFDNRRGNGYDRGRREQKPQRDWHGASLEVPTADAFDRAGLTSLQQALEILDSTPLAELEAKGLAHAGSIGPIKFALKRASEGRQMVGEAHGAVSARRAQFNAPGAGRPVGGKRGRGKTREFNAPSASRGDKGVGLAELAR